MIKFEYCNYFKKAFNSAKNKLPSSYTKHQVGLYVLKTEVRNFGADDAENLTKGIGEFIDWLHAE